MVIDAGTLERYRLTLRYKVCWHLGGSCPDIDDIVQETLTRFLRAVQEKKIRNPESTGAFLSGICNNVVQEYRRRTAKEPIPDLEVKPPEGPAISDLEQFELREAVAAALLQLPHRAQDILRAFFVEEKSKDDICQSMGLSDGQFRVALFRAKRRFREIYNREAKQKCAGRH